MLRTTSDIHKNFMGSYNNQTKESLLLRFAAGYIARTANRNTLITPTRATISKDRKQATIYVSIFPNMEKEAAISFLRRHQRGFFTYLKKESRFSHIPNVHFMFDVGEENRQHLDELTQNSSDYTHEK